MSGTLYSIRNYEIEIKSVQQNGNGTFSICDTSREELIGWLEKNNIQSVDDVVAHAKRHSSYVEGATNWQKAMYFFDNFFPPRAAIVFAGLCGIKIGLGAEYGDWETDFVAADAI